MTGVIMRLASGALGPYALACAVVLAVTGWTAAGGQTYRLSRAEKAVATAREERDSAHQALGRCDSSLASMRRALEQQSAAVARLGAEGRRRTDAAQSAVAKAQRDRASAEQTAARLLRMSPDGRDDCTRAEAAKAAIIGALS